jgi:hypothetical protein
VIQDYSGVYVDPRDRNNLEVFVEREAFLRAAANIVPGFVGNLVETTRDLITEWLELHEQEAYEIYSWKLTQGRNGKWHSELRLDPPTRPLFLSVPRSMVTETFNFYDRVNGGAWRFAPHIKCFQRLNRVIKTWAARYHIDVEWAIHAAQCAALVSLPALHRPFVVVMEATPPLPVSYFDGPFLANLTLDPTRAALGGELPAAALLPPPPLWNRRVENKSSYRARLLVWQAEYVRQVEAFADKKGERKIPRKRKRDFSPELRYTLAAEYQCNQRSLIELEDAYGSGGDRAESSDPGVAIQQEISRLFALIGLKARARTDRD